MMICLSKIALLQNTLNGINKMSRSFDGVDDIIACGNGASLADVFDGGGTFAAWIFPITLGEGNSGIIGCKVNSGALTAAWSVFMNQTNKISMRYDFSSGDAVWGTANNSIKLKVWNHVAAVYDNGNIANDPTMYINGVVMAITQTSNASGSRVSDSSNPFRIGSRAGASDLVFNGSIAEVHLYSRTLSPIEINQIMHFPGSITDSAGLWHLDGTAAPEPDSSGNGNGGTVTGAINGLIGPPISGLYFPRKRRMTSFVPAIVTAVPAAVVGRRITRNLIGVGL